MTEPRFYTSPPPLDLAGLLALTGAHAFRPADGRDVAITGVRSLDWAGPSDLACLDDGYDSSALAATDAGVCLLTAAAAAGAPAGTVALVSPEPRRAFALVAAALHPSLQRPRATVFGPGVAPGAAVDADARLEPDVSVDPGAVVGPLAEIGRGSTIGANAVIGFGVRIGRDTAIGAGAVVTDALIGDRVTVHPGVSIGHAAVTADDHDAPALGRVIVQDGAEIGPNAAVARGRRRDTVVGEKTRIDALVRIPSDVTIGRHCVIGSGVSLAAGDALPDFTIRGLDDGRRRDQREDHDA